MASDEKASDINRSIYLFMEPAETTQHSIMLDAAIIRQVNCGHKRVYVVTNNTLQMLWYSNDGGWIMSGPSHHHQPALLTRGMSSVEPIHLRVRHAFLITVVVKSGYLCNS